MRVLFLTHRVPYSPNRGDRIRAYHLIRYLSEFADVDLLSFAHSADEEKGGSALRGFVQHAEIVRLPRVRNFARAAVLLATATPLTHLLLDAPRLRATLAAMIRRNPPDLVFAYCSGMARLALQPPLAGIPLVVDFVDVDSAKWAALAAERLQPKRLVYLREARLLGRFEQRAALAARAALVINERERRSLQALAPGAPLHVVPNGVDVAHFRPPGPPGTAPTVVFVGVMNYEPNVEGVLWFAREVWPRIRARVPSARFQVVGAEPIAAVRALAGTHGIDVIGRVPDVRGYLWEAAVSVAPLKMARGLQNKVLEALAARLPVVATSQVFDGLPDPVHPGCRVADTAELFAEHVGALLGHTPDERRRLAGTANLEPLGWERQFAPLRRMLERAVLSHGP